MGGRPSRLFSICATETQWTGACSANLAAVVPGYNGGGEEGRATAGLLSESNKQEALSASMILRIFYPEYSDCCFIFERMVKSPIENNRSGRGRKGEFLSLSQ